MIILWQVKLAVKLASEKAASSRCATGCVQSRRLFEERLYEHSTEPLQMEGIYTVACMLREIGETSRRPC